MAKHSRQTNKPAARFLLFLLLGMIAVLLALLIYVFTTLPQAVEPTAAPPSPAGSPQPTHSGLPTLASTIALPGAPLTSEPLQTLAPAATQPVVEMPTLAPLTREQQPAAPTVPAAPTAPEQVAVSGGPSTHYLPLVAHQRIPPFLARNVILFIGDGMGLEHIKAGGMYVNGTPGSLSFEQFPYRGQMTTHATNMAITDSAAAATAMATGYKVDNEVISIALPGDGRDYRTLLEYASLNRMSTGLVTTTPITDATMASFGAHTSNRENAAEIASDYLYGSRPNVLFGGGKIELSPEMSVSAGYNMITDRASLLSLDTEAQVFTSGQFGTGYLPYEIDGTGDLPHLSEMTASALRILDNNPEGLFLVVEGGRIDTAAHSNCTGCMVAEMAEFDHAVQAALAWAAEHPDTLIVVLADHETGGLTVLQSGGAGALPILEWGGTSHTDAAVGVFATGPNPIQWPALIDNSQIPSLITAGAFQP